MDPSILQTLLCREAHLQPKRPLTDLRCLSTYHPTAPGLHIRHAYTTKIKIMTVQTTGAAENTDTIFLWSISTARETKNVTEKESIDIFPAWSPDGTQIAFVSEDHDYRWLIAGRLVIYTVSTGELSEVPLAMGDRVAPYAPAWSPDGRTIAFVAYDGDITSPRYDSNTPAVYTVGIDGSGLTRISTTSTRPSWSPDGRRIAFFCSLCRRSGVFSRLRPTARKLYGSQASRQAPHT